MERGWKPGDVKDERRDWRSHVHASVTFGVARVCYYYSGTHNLQVDKISPLNKILKGNLFNKVNVPLGLLRVMQFYR